MQQPGVLLADSHRVMLEGLRYLLEPTFEIVGMVDNPDSLLESADKLKPDVVVMDLSITIDTARQLKKQNPQQAIIVLSAVPRFRPIAICRLGPDPSHRCSP